MNQDRRFSISLNKKILFLSGAGASKGSEEEIAKQPPLGKELPLFCAETSNAWQIVIENKKLMSVFEDSSQGFERGMRQLNIENLNLFIKCHNDINRKLFQYEPSKNNLYGMFFNELKVLGYLPYITIATLNYDRLLPLSLAAQGILPYTKVRNGGYIPLVTEIEMNRFTATVELILPHGASYIFGDGMPVTGIPIIKNYPVEKYGKYFVDGIFKKIINTPIKAIHNESDFFQEEDRCNPPTTSYIIPEKDIVGSGTAYVLFQGQRLKEIAELVDQIVVIGVNYQSHDRFWEGIEKSKASTKIQFRGAAIPLFEKKFFSFDHQNYQNIIKQVVLERSSKNLW